MPPKLYFLVCLVALSFFNVEVLVDCADVKVDPLVRIPQGLVRGRKVTDGSYSTFLGIPYAAVDLDNPFGSSQPPKNFTEDIFNAYDGSIKCPQTWSSPQPPRAMRSDETLDCLRLNIYVPYEASSYNPLPVLVWLHGGVFAFGYAGEFNPKDLVKQGVIVVTVNYRLGPYGFMCLDIPAVPGNQGLKDQYEALRWIRDNIGAFGGNPYKVTLAGQSAGACSSLLHLYSSKDKLFGQVIAQSGTPQNEGMFVSGDVDAAIKLAQYLGLNTTESDQAIGFLSTASPDLVTGAARDLNLILRPCRERSFSGIDNFIETDPFSLKNDDKVKNTPILIGETSMETAAGYLNMFGENYFKTDPFYEKLKDNFNMEEEQLIEVANIVRHFYIADEEISKDLIVELETFEADFVFSHPLERSITKLLEENASPVYEYVFNYTGNTVTEGAGHSAELSFLFQIDDAYATLVSGDDDQLITDRITTLWVNFVKYGNPTPELSDQLPVTWEPSTKETRPYLVIDSDLTLENRPFCDRMAFWDLFYKMYGTKHKLATECSVALPIKTFLVFKFLTCDKCQKKLSLIFVTTKYKN